MEIRVIRSEEINIQLNRHTNAIFKKAVDIFVQLSAVNFN
jgi:hypothetical protein